MNITPVKTDKITVGTTTLFGVLDRAITSLSDGSVVVVTSKIISICEGRVVKIGERDKHELIEEEAQLLIPPEKTKYDFPLTITRNTLIPTAGIDESNGDGYYILWPADPYTTAREVRRYLVNQFSVPNVGVLVTDSKTTALRWGTTGISLAHAGFAALNNYIDTPDIFGRNLKVTKANIADGLAAAAVVVMGEGSEQTPLAVISDVPFVRFDASAPSEKEIADLTIDLSEDLYGPIIQAAPWQKGKGK